MKNALYVARTSFMDTPKCTLSGVLLVVCCDFGDYYCGQVPCCASAHGQTISQSHGRFVVARPLRIPKTKNIFAGLSIHPRNSKTTTGANSCFRFAMVTSLNLVNNQPTSCVTLGILGVDLALNPEPLRLKSVGEGTKQLDYGEFYSGLYEFEGHAVP
ncbi:hypothetical protein FRC12_014100 [Ceratobasidium sp. 428]|nr:hypothetical protein FRC12_014100 [Ceratobasidium sp. 428]